jgi:alpha-galactosidase/6-phospho-beta-glucosidase family protein
MLDLVRRAKAYERLTIRAATSGDRKVALEALTANPLVEEEVAPSLLHELLEAGRAHLPRFFPN